jgi:hypothetical protein
MQIKRNRILPFLLLALVLSAAIFQFFRQGQGTKGGARCEFSERFSPNALAYSRHARCRMDCRDISEDLVEQVYREGSLNCGKSDPAGAKDGNPRYALEMEDGSRGRVRIIVGDDHNEHVIITVIRLDEKDNCSCP